jgi:hypothetical protein
VQQPSVSQGHSPDAGTRTHTAGFPEEEQEERQFMFKAMIGMMQIIESAQ